jgi:hypothetical protein
MIKDVPEDYFDDNLEIVINDSIWFRANALGLKISSVHKWMFKDQFSQANEDWKFFTYFLHPNPDVFNEDFYKRIIDSTTNAKSDVSLSDFESFKDYSNDIIPSLNFEEKSGFKFIPNYSRESMIFNGNFNSMKIAKSVYRLDEDDSNNRGVVFNLFPDEYTALRHKEFFSIRPRLTTGKLRFDSEKNSSTPNLILTSSRKSLETFAKSAGVSLKEYYHPDNSRVSLFPEYRK